MIGKLLVLAGVAGAVAVVGDLVAEQRAEAAIEAAVESRVDRVGSVSADVESFPFLVRLGLSGEVSGLRMHLRDVAEQEVNVADLFVDARGIRLSRQVLLGESKVKVTAVESVTATVTIGEDEVRRVSGTEVDLLDGAVEVAGVTAEVAAGDGGITFSVGGLPSFTVPLPATDLLPCEPEVAVVVDAVEASCTADRLPQIVVDAIGASDLRS